MFIIPIFIAFFNILVLLFPSDALAAAKAGVSLWFNNVLPALLPFLIGTNLLAASGFIRSVGNLLEPVMRPLFGVPGCGAFALVTGMTSGYPMGAKVTADLRNAEELSAVEAQRLLSFTNNSGPLFLLGAVGVSLLGNAGDGYFIMLANYISALATGLLFRWYKHDEVKTQIPNAPKPKDERNFGAMLGDSVKASMETIAIIGGFIILFCVIVRMLEILGITQLFFSHTEAGKGFVTGLVEVTNGCGILASCPLSEIKLIAICGVTAFGGFCIHAQTFSFIAKTDIKMSVYLLSKTIHCLLCMVAAKLLYPLFHFDAAASVPAFLVYAPPKFFGKLAFSVISLVVSAVVLLIGAWLISKKGLKKSDPSK